MLLAIVFTLILFGLGVLFLYAVVFFFSWVSGSPVNEATRLIFRMLLGFGAGQVLGLLLDGIFLPHGNYQTLGEQAAHFTVPWLCIAVSWWFLFRVWPARWWP